MKRRRLIRTLLFAAAAGLFLWAFWIGPASLATRAYSIELPSWPTECNGYRIAVLADLHVGSPFNDLAKLERIVRATNEAAPDMVLLPGDFVVQGVIGEEFVPPEAFSKALALLRAPGGVYAVLGNHDWSYGPERIRKSFESVSIPVLTDTAVEIASDRCRFWLVGISDFWEGPHDYRSALARVPQAAVKVAFTHNPDIFPELPADVALTVAGHTHGGQVYIPLLGRPVVPSAYGQRFAIGHIVEEGRHLFVSPGLGTSILPVRFLVPPEVSLLTLSNVTHGSRPRGSAAAGQVRLNTVMNSTGRYR